MKTIALEDGRGVVVEPVAPHEAMSLAEGCRHLSGVRQWWRIAQTVASIRSIEGIPLPFPTHDKHIEGLVSRFSSQELRWLSEAALEEFGEDDLRELELRELSPLETLRIWAVIGEFEGVYGWAAPALTAVVVRKIGNEKVAFPSSKEEVKTLVARLGPAGMSKASAFLSSRKEAERAADLARRVAAKN